MRVHSFVPFLGLSLISGAVAQSDSSSGVTYYHGAVYTNSSAASRRAVLPRPQRETRKRQSAPGICQNLPSVWKYLGCYGDSPQNRALTGPSYSDGQNMSEEKCIEFCDGHGYPIAGVEYGAECYCGYSLGATGVQEPESDCNMACSGNTQELCGAGNRLNVFTNGGPVPTVLPQAGAYSSIGCYSDSVKARTLTTQIALQGNVRVTDCTSACAAGGWPYAGLEYGDQCFCGASIQNGGAPVAASACNMACTADNTELCGGAQAINIYQSGPSVVTKPVVPAGWAALPCFTDSVYNRVLSQSINLGTSNTVESCITACGNAGYGFAGVEYSDQCFCGNEVDNSPAPVDNSYGSVPVGCDMGCTGSIGETCGGAQFINLYQSATDNCGYRGCYTGYGLIQEITASLSDCLSTCNSTPNCELVQWSGEGPYDYNVCNLLGVPRSETYYTEDLTQDPYCSTYAFFDKTCSAT